MSKNLDLDKINLKKGYLQSNLDYIEKQYGHSFIITSKTLNISVPVKLYKERIEPVEIEYYTLIYDIDNRLFDMFPLKINFIDTQTKNLNSNAYISNIHATETLSGTQTVKIALEILKKFGTEKVYIIDGTTVICQQNGLDYDLTFYKLLEKNKTFYTNLGFDFDISTTDSYIMDVKNVKKLKKFINKMLNCCKKIKVSTLIKDYKKLLKMCYESIENADNKIIVRCTNIHYLVYPEQVKNIWLCNTNVMSLVQECREMLYLLKFSNEKYLYKILVNVFKSQDKCSLIELFEKWILHSKIYEIEYNNQIINREYLSCFKILKTFRYSNYSYTFN
jgi:hypothetical protein